MKTLSPRGDHSQKGLKPGYFEVKYLLPLITLSWWVCSFAQSVNLPSDHWAYDFIERLETRGLFKSIDCCSKPLSRREVSDIILQVERRLATEGDILSPAEKGLWEQLKGEFYEELKDHQLKIDPRQREPHLFSWGEGNSIIYVDLYLDQRFDLKRKDRRRISQTTLGGILRGRLKGNLVFNVDARNSLLKGADIKKETFDPSKGSPITVSGNNVYTDQAGAYFVLQLPWFQLELGKDRASWGPGYHGNLTLSENIPLFDMIKLKTRFSRFRFIYLHGFLRSKFGRKYIAAHRLELMVKPGLYLAGSETVIYGGRGLEFEYLNPLMPYHVAEHHLGDKDNNTMSLDITVSLIKNCKFYGELFIDDLTLSENPFTYFGNKFAFQVGSFLTNPLGLRDSQLRLEYTRVEPFVYTHQDSINTYLHYDKIIGYWLGPNADDLFLKIDYQPIRDIKLSFLWERIRKGEGDATTPHRKEEGPGKHFLSGVVEKKHILGFNLTCQIRRDIFLSLNYKLLRVENQDRALGKDFIDSQLLFQLYANW